MFREYIKLLRISHWLKNLFVFVPLLFSKHLLDPDYFLKVILGFIAFSLISSMVYVFNDIIDRDYDRRHPIKNKRPLATGKISLQTAYFLIGTLFTTVLILSFYLNLLFNAALLTYVVINILYTLKLKRIVIIDIFTIALGFMLRILGGAFVIDVYISSWLLLTTLFISLFLAVMKRKSEISLQIENFSTREVLGDYSPDFINQISTISSSGVVISYALYSVSKRTTEYFDTENLIYTTIFVLFGILRYMFLVYQRNKGENAIEVILSDKPMLINIVLYIISVTMIIYL